MKDLSHIIESLKVRFVKANQFRMLHPAQVVHQPDLENRFILVQQGKALAETGKGTHTLSAGQILFVPSGEQVQVTYQGQHSDSAQVLSTDAFLKYSESYFDLSGDDFISLAVDVKAFGTLNFFRSLGISSFVITDGGMRDLLPMVLSESESRRLGWEQVLSGQVSQLVIWLLRYMDEGKLFVEALTNNLAYFQDERLLKLFSYIRENLNGDLSNRRLSEIAEISEDYVGQYFKMQTGINPQDYIEYQRMERAVELLRSSKETIQAISREVGYQDTAYFCRRFKMMFGIPAGKMRKRELLLKNTHTKE
ncbi:MAG: helix-turn-helix domain-containing protein [Bernardetiaceae bacterium]